MGERLSGQRTRACREDQEFDLHKATALFVASFNHSQGNEELQGWLFDYLSRQHPQARISEPFRNQLNKRAARVIYRLFKAHHAADSAQPAAVRTGHLTIDSDQIDLTADKEARQMQAYFAGRAKPAGSWLLTDTQLTALIAAGVIERDYYWIVDRRDGRPNRRALYNANLNPSHWTDPYFSYVAAHALKGHPTEAPEFDHLYAQLGERYRRALLANNAERAFSKETYSQLLKIIHRYNRDHPRSRVFISKLR